MSNPLDVLFCWQAILAAAVISGMTQTVKTGVDAIWGHVDPAPTPNVKDMVRVGKSNRQANIWIDRFLMPAVPVLLGALYAMLVPARPELVTTYVTSNVHGWGVYTIYMAWGAAAGQFSSYTYDRVKGMLYRRARQVLVAEPNAPLPDDPSSSGSLSSDE